MKIETNEKGQLVFKEIFAGMLLETSAGEVMGICMRGTGFEFNYNGIWYEAKGGNINKLKRN